jgi:hypothetical protein
MPPNNYSLALLDPSLIGDDIDTDRDDPRRPLMRLMSMRAMASLMGDQGETSEYTGAGTDYRSGGQDAGVGQPTNDSYGRTNTGGAIGSGAGDTGSGGGGISSRLNDLSAVRPELGMPGTVPATGSRTAAASRLQRAQTDLYPPTTGGRLSRLAMTMAPAAIGLLGGGGAAGAGAATGAERAAEMGYNRRLQERNFASGQYQFEAGREERERDMMIREKVAEAQIEANKAYRLLMGTIANKRADIGQENADRAAANSGFAAVKGSDGVFRMVPLNPDQLSAINQAKLGVEQAQKALDEARTKAIPQQIEIQEKRLKIQQEMLQKALASLELQKAGLGLRERAEDFRETGPTVSSRNMAQMASATQPHVQNLRNEINEAERRGYIGPLAGRATIDFLAGRVGSTGDREADRFLGQLMTDSKLMTSAMLRTHFNGRGISLYGGFENMLAAKRSGDELQGTLDEFEDYLNGYGNMGNWDRSKVWGEMGPGQGAASKLKKNTGPRSTLPPSIPPNARIRHYTELTGGR